MRKQLTWIVSGIIGVMLSLFFMSIILDSNLFVDSVNARESMLKKSSPGGFPGISQGESTNRIKSPMQDIWAETSASESIKPGGTIFCEIQIYNQEATTIDSILIIYLAPNSKNISLGLGDKLYTEYVSNEMDTTGPPIDIPKIIEDDADFPGKLDSISWLIPKLPVTYDKDNPIRINFLVKVDNSIATSVKLNNDFLIFHIQNGKKSLIISDNKITEIELLPDFVINKYCNKDTVNIGEVVEFEIEVINNGLKLADSIFIRDEVPTEFKFIDFLDFSDSADTKTVEQPDSVRLTWWIEKIAKSTAVGHVKHVGFSAKVKDFEQEYLIHEVTNVAEFQWGEKEPLYRYATVYIRSHPDIIGDIDPINIPSNWSYEDSIRIESRVINSGGTDVSENFGVKLYYVDRERAPTIENLIWEGTVNASDDTLRALGESHFTIPTQKIKFEKGGRYKFCISVDTNNVIKESDESNNIFCRTEEIHIPVKLFLESNVFKPDNNVPLNIFAQLAKDSRVTVKVYNVVGELIKILVEDTYVEGFYPEEGWEENQNINQPITTWDGKDKNGKIVGSGVYVIILEAKNFHETRKVIVVR